MCFWSSACLKHITRTVFGYRVLGVINPKTYTQNGLGFGAGGVVLLLLLIIADGCYFGVVFRCLPCWGDGVCVLFICLLLYVL